MAFASDPGRGVLGTSAGHLSRAENLRRSHSAFDGDSLKQAEAKWRDAEIRDYDIEIEVHSRQRETYKVEVRDGAPQQAWRNGNPLKQIRTFDTWSVPGMFDTIHSDFDRTDRQGQPAPELVLRAEFDQRTGVPLKYKRIQWGADIEIWWRVTKFEVRE